MFRFLFCINILNLFLFLLSHSPLAVLHISYNASYLPPKVLHKVCFFIFSFSFFISPKYYSRPKYILGDPEVRTKEPLGTDSHQTISKNSSGSSGSRLLIGHQKPAPNQRTVSPEFFSWVRRRRLIVLPHLPGSFTKLERARETFIFYFPNQKRRNYRWVEKTLGMLSAGAIQFAPRIFFFWLITIYRK